MKLILVTTDPSARAVFDLVRQTQAAHVLDFRNLPPRRWNYTSGLTYSLGYRYTHVHHSQFLNATIKRVRTWRYPALPLVVLADAGAPVAKLTDFIHREYPLAEIENVSL